MSRGRRINEARVRCLLVIDAWGCWRVWEVEETSAGHPFLVMCSNHEWSSEWVMSRERLSEG